jgi:antirestriction protein ArdC
MASNIYETVTDRIISALEGGVIPWKKEWRNVRVDGGGLPYNLVSKKPYRGINILTLACSGYSSAGWCTYKQAQELGYQVRKGEKSSPVVFWSFPTKEQLIANPDKAPFAKFYNVFNVEQLDGVPAALPFDAEEFDPIAECEALAAKYMESSSHPTLAHGGNRAYFQPSRDHVQMPERSQFLTAGGYYCTLFHEFAHSTGVKARCDRSELQAMKQTGDEAYSREELVAEFAAAFMCAETGISNDELVANSTAYIQGFLRALKNDKRMAVEAAQRAQRATDYILQRSYTAATTEEVAA